MECNCTFYTYITQMLNVKGLYMIQYKKYIFHAKCHLPIFHEY